MGASEGDDGAVIEAGVELLVWTVRKLIEPLQGAVEWQCHTCIIILFQSLGISEVV